MNTYRDKDYIAVHDGPYRASFKRDDAKRKMQTPLIVKLPPVTIFHFPSGEDIHLTYEQWLNLKHVMEALEYEIEGEICWIEEAEYEAYCASLEAKEAREVEEF